MHIVYDTGSLVEKSFWDYLNKGHNVVDISFEVFDNVVRYLGLLLYSFDWCYG